MAYIGSKDPWIEHAKQIIFADDGKRVSMELKNKDLLKYGRHTAVQTTLTTLMTLPTGIYNETYVSTNIITSIVSTSGSDTTTVKVEGHTVTDGNFDFVVQEITLTGQTAATLATPLARTTRAYASAAVDLIGTISVCETDTYASGVPATPAGVHLQIRAGKNQTEKASTTLSKNDYWVITAIYADMLNKTAAFGEVDLEIRLKGKVFRETASMGVSDAHSGRIEFTPYIIVPPNSDIRLRAAAGTNGRDVSGGIEGVLLIGDHKTAAPTFGTITFTGFAPTVA